MLVLMGWLEVLPRLGERGPLRGMSVWIVLQGCYDEGEIAGMMALGWAWLLVAIPGPRWGFQTMGQSTAYWEGKRIGQTCCS